jgi:uncharacterized membrane protein
MPLTTQPFAQSPELNQVRSALDLNVPGPERLGSAVAGAALLIGGASRRSLGGLLLALAGGALLLRGATGHCLLYQQLGINSAKLNTETGVPGNKGIKVEKTVTIRRSPQELYRFWRELENLPRFLEHVKSVREIDQQRSHWIVKGPAGSELEWTAQIITDREGELIAWESLPGAEVQNAGSVRFEASADGRSTEMKVALQYQPPAGVLGAAVARLFGEDPAQQLDKDLTRLKEIVESEATGAVTTVA